MEIIDEYDDEDGWRPRNLKDFAAESKLNELMDSTELDAWLIGQGLTGFMQEETTDSVFALETMASAAASRASLRQSVSGLADGSVSGSVGVDGPTHALKSPSATSALSE